MKKAFRRDAFFCFHRLGFDIMNAVKNLTNVSCNLPRVIPRRYAC